tara:strand:+ start:599 stop:829 length:231 start_codon:yes stop_codon:yes gene_type:complete
MKESKLLEMSNKVEALTKVSQHLFNEVANLKDLSVGTLETIKLMPDYDEAFQKLKDQVAQAVSKEQEANAGGETSK